MNKKLTDAINTQIVYEFFSSHLYLAMASYAASLGYNGFSTWLLAQAEEEREHAYKFINYLQQRGERAIIYGFENPKNEYSSILQVFIDGLGHEKLVTSKINELMMIATESNDFATINFLNWFVNEQVEEEANFGEIVNKLKMINNNPMGLYQLDKELGARPGALTVAPNA